MRGGLEGLIQKVSLENMKSKGSRTNKLGISPEFEPFEVKNHTNSH
jgi:hypothetical protein